jgi:ABC-type branched-subunit amino acid transport system substrate-binding protein
MFAPALLLLGAACGGSSDQTPSPTQSGVPSGPPADALLVIADPSSTHSVLAEALRQDSVDKFFFSSSSMDAGSFEGLTLPDGATIWGARPAPPFAQDADFNAAYEAAYGLPASDVFGTAAAYDSVYIVALAAVAADSTDRAAIAQGVTFVANSPGTIVNYGADAFAEAVGVLEEGGDVNYIGASGQVDLDERGEIAKTSAQTWRLLNGMIAPIETRDVDLAAEAGAVLPSPIPLVRGGTPDTPLAIGLIVADDDSGAALADAARLAVDEINSTGGVWGSDVILNIETISGVEQVNHATNFLIADDAVEAIVGPTDPAAAKEAAGPAKESNVALLTLTTDAAFSSIADDSGVLFRLVASDALQMPVLANLFLESANTATPGVPAGGVCVVYQRGDAFERMAAAFSAAMKHKGAAVRGSVPFDPASADLTALLGSCIGR